jgi:predicted nucleic acid-binding protein
VVLIDTSAWIEFLRDTGSETCERVQTTLSEDFATADPIRMELLAGARDEQHLQQLRRLLARGVTLRVGPIDYDQAATLYRQCRLSGETVRKLTDCLIAAIAIRNDATVLHRDNDFAVLDRHTSLRTLGQISGSERA